MSFPQIRLWETVENGGNRGKICKVFHVIHRIVWKTVDKPVNIWGEIRQKMEENRETQRETQQLCRKYVTFWAERIPISIHPCGKMCGMSWGNVGKTNDSPKTKAEKCAIYTVCTRSRVENECAAKKLWDKLPS